MRINYTYNATVVRVVDGDTVILKVDFGFRVFAESPFRLWGINCPEMSTPEGKLAKKRAEELLPVGKEILAKTYKNPIDWQTVASEPDYLLFADAIFAVVDFHEV